MRLTFAFRSSAHAPTRRSFRGTRERTASDAVRSRRAASIFRTVRAPFLIAHLCPAEKTRWPFETGHFLRQRSGKNEEKMLVVVGLSDDEGERFVIRRSSAISTR